MNLKLSLLTILLTGLFCGCIDYNKRMEADLNSIDNMMDQCQDSASYALELLDSMRKQVHVMPESQQMQFKLIYAKAMNKAYVSFTTDSIAKQFVAYYDKKGNANEKMLAHYLLGCAYRDMGEVPLALQCYYDAVSFDDNSKQSYMMLNRIHGQIAQVFCSQAMVKEQIAELDQSMKYALLAGDTVDALLRENRKAEAYYTIEMYDSAFYHKEHVIKELQRRGEHKTAAQICGTFSDNNFENGMTEEVKKRMDFYEQHSGYFQDGEIERGREVYYYNKGRYYLAVNKTDSAELMFRKCLRFIADPNMKVAAYHGLSMLYDRLKVADSTAKYALLAYDANDSAYQINVAEKALNIKSLYNYSKHQQAAIESLKERNSAYNWLLVSIVVIIALALTSVFIIKCIRKRSLDKQIQMRERYETEKKLLQREMEELNALLEEKEYIIGNSNETFEKRKRELFLEIEDKEKEILKLQERVLKYEKELSIKDEAETEEMLMHSDIRAQFAYFASHVVEKPSDENWQQLMLFVRSVLPKLFVLLKNNKISEREMKVSLLIRFGFKPGEIAAIMDCSFPEVSLIRSRLLKKIYGIDGKAADFDRRLMLMY